MADGWYLGSVPPFGANAAYSLYGVLTGSKDKGCSAAHYINSFVTTGGVESFTNALAQVGIDDFEVYNADNEQDQNGAGQSVMSVTSVCQVPDGFELDYDNYYNNNNGYSSYEGIYHYTAGYNSYGTVCSKAKFVKAEFEGALCQGDKVLDVTGTLDVFNNVIQNSGCVAVYDSQVDYSSNNEEDRNNEDQADEIPVETLLQTSKTCNYRDDSCPDPHGKLASMTRALERATSSVDFTSVDHRRSRILSGILLTIGVISFAAAVLIAMKESCKPPSKNRRKKKKKRSSKNKSQKQEEEPEVTKPSVETTPKKHPVSRAAAAVTAGVTAAVSKSRANLSQEVVLDDADLKSFSSQETGPEESPPAPEESFGSPQNKKRSTSSIFGRFRRGRSKASAKDSGI